MSKRRRGGGPPRGGTGRPAGREWPELMKLREACEYLGVSHAKITALVHSGAIPFSYSKLGHRLKLVKKELLDELIMRKSQP